MNWAGERCFEVDCRWKVIFRFAAWLCWGLDWSSGFSVGAVTRDGAGRERKKLGSRTPAAPCPPF